MGHFNPPLLVLHLGSGADFLPYDTNQYWDFLNTTFPYPSKVFL